MFKTLITQTNWSLLGTVYGFAIGFFVKMYLVNKVGANAFGLYTIAQGFQSAVATFIAFAIPSVIIKFLPEYINQKEAERATILTTKSLTFLMGVSLVAMITMILANGLIAKYIFHKENLETIIALSALYIPLSLYSIFITSVYRSFLKIREIVLYGTLYHVTIRALLTFLVFALTNDIIYFLWIEIIAQLISICLLTFKFHSNNLKLFDKEALNKELPNKKEIFSFAKIMYSNLLIGFVGGYAMTFIMSIILPAYQIGIFAILMTIAGLTNFLQQNVNKVFAPIISSLVSKNDYYQLSLLYKESTFILNIVTIPFILVAVLFSKDILKLYGNDFTPYAFELTILFLANYFSLMVGSSGMMMMMGGLEKEQLKIQISLSIFNIVTSLIFLPIFGLTAAIFIKMFSAIILNDIQIYYIYKKHAIWPWDHQSYILIFLFFISLFITYHFHTLNFDMIDFIIYPIIIYVLYFVLFSRKIYYIYKLTKEY